MVNISIGINEDEQLEILADFISYDKDKYGAGMDNRAITLLNREKHLKGRCSFFDPHYVNGNVSTLNTELAGQNSPFLVTSSISVYGNERSIPRENGQVYNDLFKNTLNAISHCRKNFDKIVIPIGCQEEGKPGHNIALVLERDRIGFKATILDQMGGNSYVNTKAKMIEDLTSIGVENIDYNRYPISHNRNDCATITSLLSDFACDGLDMRELKDNTDNYYQCNGTPQIGTSVIDEQHENDQMILVDTADKTAENLINKSFSREEILRGLSDIPTPRDIVYSRVRKYSDAKRNSSINNANTYSR